MAVGTTISASSSPASAPIPGSINDVGTYGEDLYDQVKLGDWAKAKAYLDSLHAAAPNLPSGEQVRAQRNDLDSAIARLDKAVAARDRSTALEVANRATYLSAQMTTPYHGVAPTEVLLLDYYGRELEIWAARRNLPKLKETAAALESTWSALKPTVERRGGALAARNTDVLVARIKSAKSPADYARVATPFLDQVDELEKVFTTQ
jgi:multidrug efflux pump subunit AcrA (membrane-fusion protein)